MRVRPLSSFIGCAILTLAASAFMGPDFASASPLSCARNNPLFQQEAEQTLSKGNGPIPLRCASDIPGASQAIDRSLEQIMSTPEGKSILGQNFGCNASDIALRLGVSYPSAERIARICSGSTSSAESHCRPEAQDPLSAPLATTPIQSLQAGSARAFLVERDPSPHEPWESYTYQRGITVLVTRDGALPTGCHLHRDNIHELAMHLDQKWLLDLRYSQKLQSSGGVSSVLSSLNGFYQASSPIVREALAAIRATRVEGKILKQMGCGSEVKREIEYTLAKNASRSPSACRKAVQHFADLIVPPSNSKRSSESIAQSIWQSVPRFDYRYYKPTFVEAAAGSGQVRDVTASPILGVKALTIRQVRSLANQFRNFRSILRKRGIPDLLLTPDGRKPTSDLEMAKLVLVMESKAGRLKNYAYVLQTPKPSLEEIRRKTRQSIDAIVRDPIRVDGVSQSMCQFLSTPELGRENNGKAFGPRPRWGGGS